MFTSNIFSDNVWTSLKVDVSTLFTKYTFCFQVPNDVRRKLKLNNWIVSLPYFFSWWFFIWLILKVQGKCPYCLPGKNSTNAKIFSKSLLTLFDLDT